MKLFKKSELQKLFYVKKSRPMLARFTTIFCSSKKNYQGSSFENWKINLPEYLMTVWIIRYKYVFILKRWIPHQIILIILVNENWLGYGRKHWNRLYELGEREKQKMNDK